MHVIITVKMEITSDDDPKLVGQQVADCQQHFNMLKNESVFGSPDAVALRYLVELVKDAPTQVITQVITQQDVQNTVQEHGVPNIE